MESERKLLITECYINLWHDKYYQASVCKRRADIISPITDRELEAMDYISNQRAKGVRYE